MPRCWPVAPKARTYLRRALSKVKTQLGGRGRADAAVHLAADLDTFQVYEADVHPVTEVPDDLRPIMVTSDASDDAVRGVRRRRRVRQAVVTLMRPVIRTDMRLPRSSRSCGSS